MTEPLYLRPDIQVEPLVDQWYAWAHLIPPATTARNITHRHFRIMDSYLNAPQVHAKAVKDPKMLGGPFIDHEGRRVEEIRALKERTMKKRARLMEMSAALERLDELLRTGGDGHSLVPLYADVPAVLQGYVELAYDIRHNATFRLIEPLLYRSDLYDSSGQSLMLSVTTGDNRPFALSTPRLAGPGVVHLPWSFADDRVDDLFRLKTDPMPWASIRDRFGVADEDAKTFRSFLTTERAARYERYTGSGLRWRYFGHACILVETRTMNILFDPALSYTYESDISRYTYADLPERIDCVFVTHNHQDHILLETLLQLRHKIGQVIVPRGGSGALQDPSLKLALERIGFPMVRELGELESIDVGGATVAGIPFLGEHADLAVSTKLGYVVQFGDERLMFAADSCNNEPRMYSHVHDMIGDVGTLFLGMECQGAPLSWLYGPLLLRPIDRGMDQARRLNGSDYAQAIDLVNRFGCHDVYVYAMGQEPWLNYVMSIKYTEQSKPIVESDRLLHECRSRGIVAERLFGEKEILIDRLDGAPMMDRMANPVAAAGRA
jgi:L-ascorbate metabolism protein UlaG (beta-lactamase superfamily)